MNALGFMAKSENVVLIVSHHTCVGANLLSQPQSYIGRLIIRYLFGFTGDALTVGAIGEGATRDTSDAIEAYMSERVPNSE